MTQRLLSSNQSASLLIQFVFYLSFFDHTLLWGACSCLLDQLPVAAGEMLPSPHKGLDAPSNVRALCSCFNKCQIQGGQSLPWICSLFLGCWRTILSLDLQPVPASTARGAGAIPAAGAHCGFMFRLLGTRIQLLPSTATHSQTLLTLCSSTGWFHPKCRTLILSLLNFRSFMLTQAASLSLDAFKSLTGFTQFRHTNQAANLPGGSSWNFLSLVYNKFENTEELSHYDFSPWKCMLGYDCRNAFWNSLRKLKLVEQNLGWEVQHVSVQEQLNHSRSW